MDFADFSGLHGDVVEVRNTFLHVRATTHSNLEAAARSDFVCNYGEYPELASESPSITPTSKSRCRRPGKKARARMVRRSTITSMPTDISTELLSEPHLESSSYGPPPDTQCKSLSEPAPIDDYHCSTVEAQEPSPMPQCSTAEAHGLASTKVASSRVAGALVVGAMCIVAVVALFWSIGLVQIHIPHSVGRHGPADVTSHSLQALKEEMEKRLASQELMIEDLMSQVLSARATTKLDKGSDEWSNARDRDSDQKQRGELEVGADLGVSAVLSNSSLNYFPHGSSHSDLTSHLASASSVSASRSGWLHLKTLCSIWISTVVVCSVVQEPFRSLINDKVHEKSSLLNIPMSTKA